MYSGVHQTLEMSKSDVCRHFFFYENILVGVIGQFDQTFFKKLRNICPPPLTFYVKKVVLTGGQLLRTPGYSSNIYILTILQTFIS